MSGLYSRQSIVAEVASEIDAGFYLCNGRAYQPAAGFFKYPCDNTT